MNAKDRLLRNPLVALAPSNEEYLAYDAENFRLHRLNAAAALILELSDGNVTVESVCQQVSPLFTDANPDGVAQWIEKGIADGLLRLIRPDESPPAPPSPREFASIAKRLRKDGKVLAAFVCQHYATLLSSDDAAQWHALGELAHIVGRREDARDAYERYFQSNPGDAEVEQILVSLRDHAAPPRAPNQCIEQLYSRFAEFYENNMRGDLDYQGPERLAEALDLELQGCRDLDVLELGCGTGLAGRYLRQRARHLSGIDISASMAAHARATGCYDEIEIAEITEWLSRSELPAFNLVAACDTLIYFGDLSQVIIPAARRIHPGGWFAFTVERGDTIPFRLTDSGRYTHTDAHILEVAKAAGLTVARLTEGFIRYEYGTPVAGLVAVLRR